MVSGGRRRSGSGCESVAGTVAVTEDRPMAGVDFSLFVVPGAREAAGFDYVSVQDHPYNPGFYETWTLLTWIAATTERVKLYPNVANLPLRPPAMLAKAAASLDLLSGGRVELGLGAGAFWDPIAAMGGPRRAPGEALAAWRRGSG